MTLEMYAKDSQHFWIGQEPDITRYMLIKHQMLQMYPEWILNHLTINHIQQIFFGRIYQRMYWKQFFKYATYF